MTDLPSIMAVEAGAFGPRRWDQEFVRELMEEADVLSLFEAPKSNYTRALLSALPENAVGDRLPTVTDMMFEPAPGVSR